jgi:hypothetical protein
MKEIQMKDFEKRRRFRAGDIVYYAKHNQQYVLAFDEENQIVMPRWPIEQIHAEKVELVKEASDYERISMLRESAALSWPVETYRSGIAHRQLMATVVTYYIDQCPHTDEHIWLWHTPWAGGNAQSYSDAKNHAKWSLKDLASRDRLRQQIL